MSSPRTILEFPLTNDSAELTEEHSAQLLSTLIVRLSVLFYTEAPTHVHRITWCRGQRLPSLPEK